MLDPEWYFPLDRTKLTEQLVLVCSDLEEARRSAWEAECEHRRQWEAAIREVGPESVSGAERHAKAMTLGQTNTLAEMRLNVQLHEDHLTLIRDLLALCNDA